MLLLLLAVTIVTTVFSWPREYRAKVMMEVRPDEHSVFGNQGGLDPNFIAVLPQILRTREILQPVVEQLELGKAYAKSGRPASIKEAIARLARSVQVRAVRNTGLIELSVYDRNPKRAADIANTIAVVYRKRRTQDVQNAWEHGLEELKREVDKQRKFVEQNHSELDRLRERDGVIDSDPERGDAALSPSDGTADISSYAEAKHRYVQSRRVLQAGETKLAAELFERETGSMSVIIWEKAEPPPSQSSFSLRRIWNSVWY